MTVLLHAVVADAEQAAMVSAAERLSAALTQAAGMPIEVGCVFPPTLAAIPASPDGAIVIASLLPEVAAWEAPWPEVAQRLRAACRQHAGRKLFVCTVLRHVPPGRDAEAQRIRIRRLNLLAAELSHEFGLHVIDIDRGLADIGARVLRTDYRLGGPLAIEAAAGCIALTLLAVGLDEHAAWEAQDAARAAIAARHASWRDSLAPAHDMIRWDIIPMGAGRRKQRVSAIVDTMQQDRVGWLLRCVLTRRIGLAEAMGRLTFAIGQRGLRASLSMLLVGVARLLRGGARAAR